MIFKLESEVYFFHAFSFDSTVFDLHNVLSLTVNLPVMAALAVALSEPRSVHCCPYVHPESGPSQHGPGPSLSGADDQAARAGPGSLGSPGSAHGEGGGEGEGENQEAVRDGAQQASGLGKHHGGWCPTNAEKKKKKRYITISDILVWHKMWILLLPKVVAATAHCLVILSSRKGKGGFKKVAVSYRFAI